MYTCIIMCMHACMHACTYMCLSVYISIYIIYVYVYIYIHLSLPLLIYLKDYEANYTATCLSCFCWEFQLRTVRLRSLEELHLLERRVPQWNHSAEVLKRHPVWLIFFCSVTPTQQPEQSGSGKKCYSSNSTDSGPAFFSVF